MSETAASPTARLAAREIGPLLVFVLAGCALLLFWRLASEVGEGDSFAFDRQLLLAFRQPGDLAAVVGPRWLRIAMVDITALGGGTVLTLVALVAVGYLVAARKYRTSLFLAAAALSGGLLEAGLKGLLGRPRPSVVPHLVEVTTLSFPSGHAMNSAIIYLTIALVLSRTVAARRVRLYLRGVAIVLVTTIGVSRVYLGVHYPSDVLGGWLVGSAWATLCWSAALWLQHRRQIEAAPRD